MKRVALLSFHTCPYEKLGEASAGGMNVYIRDLVTELSQKGWYGDIFTRAHTQAHEDRLPIDSHVHLIHLPVGDTELAKEELFSYTKEFADKIIAFIHNHHYNYTVIHAHYYLSGIAGLIIKKRLNLPLVQTYHTLAWAKELYGGEVNKTRVQLEKRLAPKVDHTIAFTASEKKILTSYYHVKTNAISIIPPGVNTHVFHPYDKDQSRKKFDLPADKQIVLFVGRIDPIKDITTLVKAIGILRTMNLKLFQNLLVLLIGGDTKNRSFWQKKEVQNITHQVTQDQLDHYIRFLGSVTHRQLPHYYACADVVVLPSRYESFGLVVLEAMSVGVPVLTSKVGGLRFMVEEGKTGMTFASQNPYELACKLIRILSDRQLQQSLINQARAFANKLSWEHQGEKIIRVYDTISS